MLLPLMASAQNNVPIDGMWFNINKAENFAEVTNEDYKAWERGGSYSGDVVIPSSVVYEGVTYPVTTIGTSAFGHCAGVTSITIPTSVTMLGSGCFEFCTSLKTIEIPTSVTFIGTDVFYGCSALESITIPNSVNTIYSQAFRKCSSLKEIVIPESITIIRYATFHSCTNLRKVYLPRTLTTLENEAFRDCSSLDEIHCAAVVPPTVESNFTFSGIRWEYSSHLKITKLYVPRGSKEAYASASEWNSFRDIYEEDFADGIADLTTDGDARYTTLNGTKVSNRNQPGIYIENKAGKTRKVLVK